MLTIPDIGYLGGPITIVRWGNAGLIAGINSRPAHRTATCIFNFITKTVSLKNVNTKPEIESEDTVCVDAVGTELNIKFSHHS